LHWFTDAVSGLIYGTLILAVFIATIRLVIGPGRRSGAIGLASVTVASASAAAEPSLMADETTGPHTAALP
jgi:hypothetical protein